MLHFQTLELFIVKSNSIIKTSTIQEEQIAMLISEVQHMKKQITDLTDKNQALEDKVNTLEEEIKLAAMTPEQQRRIKFSRITQSNCAISEDALPNLITRTDAIDLIEHFKKSDVNYLFMNTQGKINTRAIELFINLFKLFINHKDIISSDSISQLNSCLLTASQSLSESTDKNWSMYLTKLFEFHPEIQIKIINDLCHSTLKDPNPDTESAHSILIKSEVLLSSISQITNKNQSSISYILKSLLQLVFSLYEDLHSKKLAKNTAFKNRLVGFVSSYFKITEKLGLTKDILATCEALSSYGNSQNFDSVIETYGFPGFYLQLLQHIENPAIKSRLIFAALSSTYRSWFKKDDIAKFFKAFGAETPRLSLVFYFLLNTHATREFINETFSPEKLSTNVDLTQAPDFTIIKLVLNNNFKFRHCHLKLDNANRYDYQYDYYQMLYWLRENDRSNCPELKNLRQKIEKHNQVDRHLYLQNLLTESIGAANIIKNNKKNPSPEGKRFVFCLYVMIYAYSKLNPLSYPVITGVGMPGEEISICGYSDYSTRDNNTSHINESGETATSYKDDQSAGVELKTLPSVRQTNITPEKSTEAGMFGSRLRSNSENDVKDSKRMVKTELKSY